MVVLFNKIKSDRVVVHSLLGIRNHKLCHSPLCLQDGLRLETTYILVFVVLPQIVLQCTAHLLTFEERIAET